MADGLTDGTYVLEGAPRFLDRALRDLHRGSSWNTVRQAIRSGKVTVDGEVAREPRTEVGPGSVLGVRMAAPRRARPPELGPEAMALVDAHVVVVRKPPGLNTVFHEGVAEPNLRQLVGEMLGRRRRPAKLLVVHRLDRDTSGLVLFARTPAALGALKDQFRHRSVDRRYLALAAGRAQRATYRSRLVYEDDGHGHSTRAPHRGKLAITHVEPVEYLPGATLVACHLDTGRTHQIRIHLAEASHPVLGDRLYGPRLSAFPAVPRLMLHAATLGFTHPGHRERIELEEPLCPDMAQVLAELRH